MPKISNRRTNFFSSLIATSDNNAAHRILIQYCFEESLTPVETKREMETIERHKHVSQTLVYTWHYRFKDSPSGEPMEESRGRPTKRDDKNQVMDVIREDRCLIVGVVLVTCLGLGNHLFRGFCQIFQ